MQLHERWSSVHAQLDCEDWPVLLSHVTQAFAGRSRPS